MEIKIVESIAVLEEFLSEHPKARIYLLQVNYPQPHSKSTDNTDAAHIAQNPMIMASGNVAFEDIELPEYKHIHFTRNHAEYIADLVMRACIDAVDYFMILSDCGNNRANGIAKAICETFGIDHDITAYNEHCYSLQLLILQRMYRNIDICLCQTTGILLREIADAYHISRERARQITVECRPDFLRRCFGLVDKSNALDVLKVIEKQVPNFKSKFER